jgi:hypothetical protein
MPADKDQKPPVSRGWLIAIVVAAAIALGLIAILLTNLSKGDTSFWSSWKTNMNSAPTFQRPELK